MKIIQIILVIISFYPIIYYGIRINKNGTKIANFSKQIVKQTIRNNNINENDLIEDINKFIKLIKFNAITDTVAMLIISTFNMYNLLFNQLNLKSLIIFIILILLTILFNSHILIKIINEDKLINYINKKVI